MSRVELTDDEVGMLNWLREFPNQRVAADGAVERLIAKGLVEIVDGEMTISPAGDAWLDSP